jgi:hypothetical protein
MFEFLTDFFFFSRCFAKPIDAPFTELIEDHCIGGQIEFNADAAAPLNNYAFFALADIDIRRLIIAACPTLFRGDVNAAIPGWVSDIAEVSNLKASAAIIPRQVNGVYIPSGYQLNGTLRIWDVSAHFESNIDPLSGVHYLATLTPVNILNGVFVFKKCRFCSDGPLMEFAARYNPISISAQIAGFVSIGGLADLEATMMLDSNGGYLSVTANVYNFLRAQLALYGSLGDFSSPNLGIS